MCICDLHGELQTHYWTLNYSLYTIKSTDACVDLYSSLIWFQPVEDPVAILQAAHKAAAKVWPQSDCSSGCLPADRQNDVCLVYLCFLLCDELVIVVLGCGWVANEPHAPTHMLCLPCSHRLMPLTSYGPWHLNEMNPNNQNSLMFSNAALTQWLNCGRLALEHVAKEHWNRCHGYHVTCRTCLTPESNTYSTYKSSCDLALFLREFWPKLMENVKRSCYNDSISSFSGGSLEAFIHLSHSIGKKMNNCCGSDTTKIPPSL